MTLRILANENIPGDTIDALCRAGYDIVWTRTDSPGSSDETVLNKAQSENRIIITFDKDFGELAFRKGLPSSSGVILFRVTATSPSLTTTVILAALKSRSDWAGYFSVIEKDRIRMTPFPNIRK